MCRSDALIGLSDTRTSASPSAKGGVGISASSKTLFGSPVSRKISAFSNASGLSFSGGGGAGGGFACGRAAAGGAVERDGDYGDVVLLAVVLRGAGEGLGGGVA